MLAEMTQAADQSLVAQQAWWSTS